VSYGSAAPEKPAAATVMFRDLGERDKVGIRRDPVRLGGEP